ncbi:MAG: VOC family protein [Acidimicrobiales bacterium]
MTKTAFRPRINHVAISVDAALMDEKGRADLLDFYGEVFGWTEADNSTETGNPLIMSTGAGWEFVYFLPADPFLIAPPLDHFGLEVASVAELEEILGRAKAYQARDDRVRIIDIHARSTPGPTADHVLTSAYIGFVIPLMVELQHLATEQRAS